MTLEKRVCPRCSNVQYSANAMTVWRCAYCGALIEGTKVWWISENSAPRSVKQEKQERRKKAE